MGRISQAPAPVLSLQPPVVVLAQSTELLLLRFAEAAAKVGGLTIPDLRRLVRFAHVVRAIEWWAAASVEVRRATLKFQYTI